MAIDCCNGCVPPERNPYCHSTCRKYAEQKAKHDAEKAAADQRKAVADGLTAQALKGVAIAQKSRKRRGY